MNPTVDVWSARIGDEPAPEKQNTAPPPEPRLNLTQPGSSPVGRRMERQQRIGHAWLR